MDINKTLQQANILSEKDGLDFDESVDNVLFELIEAKKLLDKASQELLDKLKQSFDNSPVPVNSVSGTKIKINYQAFGAKYDYTDKISRDFLKEKTTYTLETKKVEEYLNSHGALPVGVVEKERTKKLIVKEIQKYE